MFFIGIFGIEQKEKLILTKQNIICPICNALGRFDVVKVYSFFHFFFIPLFRWNVKYYIKTHCGRICELKKEIGLKIENGEDTVIKKEDIIRGEQIFVCPNCQAQVNPSFRYCPHCGKEI